MRRDGGRGSVAIYHCSSPKHALASLEPDFVNSQALTTRASSQSPPLAYPLIQPAVKDLFSDDPESASFASVDAREATLQ